MSAYRLAFIGVKKYHQESLEAQVLAHMKFTLKNFLPQKEDPDFIFSLLKTLIFRSGLQANEYILPGDYGR